MSFTKLLTIQQELMQITPSPGCSRLYMATLDELGELAHKLKWGMVDEFVGSCDFVLVDGWCWWNRDIKPFSKRKEVLEELADILHFLLTLYLTQWTHWEMFATYLETHVWREPKESAKTVPVDSWELGDFCFQKILFGAYNLNSKKMFGGFIDLACSFLGFRLHEVEEAYKKKAQINKERWTIHQEGVPQVNA